MTVTAIREKLHDLIDTVSDRQVKEIYSFAEREITDREADKRRKIELMKQAASDPMFLADMKEINDDFGVVDSENI